MTPHRSPERLLRCLRRRISSSAAAATPARAAAPMISLAAVPDDLIFDILSRLPVKSVCRFRCVSRRWQAMASDPALVASHRSRHTEPLVVAVTSSPQGYDLRLMDMDGSLVKVTKDVCGSRLLSTTMSDLTCVTQGNNGRAQVIDPATGKVLLDWKHVGQYGCDYIFGFGRAVPSGSYKLVRIEDYWDFSILTLGHGIRWRLASYPPAHLSRIQDSPVVINGAMYIFVSRVGKLLCFDLESEQWKKKMIQGPREVVGPEVWERTKQVCLSELNDTLCMVQSESFATNLWLLTDSDNGIWIRMYTVPIAIPAHHCMTLRVTHDGDRLIFCSSSSDGKEKGIQVYDLRKRTRVELPGLGGNNAINVGLCSLHLDRFVSPSSRY